MGLWKITDKGPSKVEETKFKKEKLLEEHLEDWISSDPSILGEPLLIIGRQVLIPDTKDRLDLLALDPQGNAVIIELKRGKLKDPVDMQALRYASYISKWSFEEFESLARNHMKKVGDSDFNFNAVYESFCTDSGVDEIPDLNKDQRAIVVGSSVRDKLGSVALWLFEHGIEIKVIEVNAYKDGNGFFIEPSTVVPLQVNKFAETGRPKPGRSPWMTDGKTWHMEKRCSPKTKDMFTLLDTIIQDEFDVDGPRWNQKLYVAYRISNYNWLSVITNPNSLRLDFLVKANAFKSEDVAKRLSIVKFEKEESMSEKLGLPSSVLIKNRNEISDRMYIRVKDDFNLESKEFLDFLKDTYKAFPK
jgi:hypothetical protein